MCAVPWMIVDELVISYIVPELFCRFEALYKCFNIKWVLIIKFYRFSLRIGIDTAGESMPPGGGSKGWCNVVWCQVFAQSDGSTEKKEIGRDKQSR